MLNESTETEQEVGGTEQTSERGCASMSPALRWAAAFAALGGILFGYDIGIISGALLQLEEEWDLSSFQQELVVSLMLLGAIFGSITGGYIIDYFGRRRSIIGNAGLFVIGAIGLCAAQDLATLLIVSRLCLQLPHSAFVCVF